MDKGLFFLVLLIVGCSPAIPNSTYESQSDVLKSDTNLSPSIEQPTGSPEPVDKPTVPLEDDLQENSNAFALNDVASQTRGGVTVDVARLFVTNKLDLDPSLYPNELFSSEEFVNKDVVVWLVFNIRNDSEYTIHLHPRRGAVQINDKTIELTAYDSYTSIDENFDGEYLPGESAFGGGIWIGLGQLEVDMISEMVVSMHGPHLVELDEYAEAYNIVVDLSDHVFETLPTYLD